MKAIIVDDEETARLTLRTILNDFFKDVIIVGEASTPGSGAQLITELKPDVVFVDIQMAGGTGFEMLESLTRINFQIVFVTAYKKHAYDSFRFQASDYLLKPIRIVDLRAAIDKVREKLKASARYGNTMLRRIHQEQLQMQLIVPELDGFIVLKLSDIIHCESSRNYTVLTLVENRQILAGKSLADFEELLKELGFLRVHKSHIINLNYVVKYNKGRGGEVVMIDGSIVPVSRDRKEQLLEAMHKC